MGGQELLWRDVHVTPQWMVMMDDNVSAEIVYRTFSHCDEALACNLILLNQSMENKQECVQC